MAKAPVTARVDWDGAIATAQAALAAAVADTVQAAMEQIAELSPKKSEFNEKTLAVAFSGVGESSFSPIEHASSTDEISAAAQRWAAIESERAGKPVKAPRRYGGAASGANVPGADAGKTQALIVSTSGYGGWLETGTSKTKAQPYAARGMRKASIKTRAVDSAKGFLDERERAGLVKKGDLGIVIKAAWRKRRKRRKGN